MVLFLQLFIQEIDYEVIEVFVGQRFECWLWTHSLSLALDQVKERVVYKSRPSKDTFACRNLPHD